jgi:MFS superfamily sulfate permease-like transporter
MSKTFSQKMQENISHGLTVALVGVPLCTAIAISSGARPMMGLQSLIYGSFIGGFCAGSDFTIFSVAGSLINVLK